MPFSGGGSGTGSVLSVFGRAGVITANTNDYTDAKIQNSPTQVLTNTGDLLYASAANTLARRAVGAVNQVVGVNSSGLPDFVTLDGWIASADTWVFASSTTFTITGVDRTAVYTTGTRLKCTNSGSKFFVVVSSAFGTDTTVTVSGGSDYSLANAAITAASYSYVANPQGFPGWFAFAPAPSGWAATPTSEGRFSVVGRICNAFIYITGTSNSTSAGATLAIARANQAQANSTYYNAIRAADNGANLSTAVMSQLPRASATVSYFKDWTGTGWTSSGTKTVWSNFTYEI